MAIKSILDKCLCKGFISRAVNYLMMIALSGAFSVLLEQKVNAAEVTVNYEAPITIVTPGFPMGYVVKGTYVFDDSQPTTSGQYQVISYSITFAGDEYVAPNPKIYVANDVPNGSFFRDSYGVASGGQIGDVLGYFQGYEVTNFGLIYEIDANPNNALSDTSLPTTLDGLSGFNNGRANIAFRDPDTGLYYAQHGIISSIEVKDSISVAIDIKPSSEPNCFNINDRGVIPVAILGSNTFDVNEIVYESLSFAGLDVRVRGNKGPLCHVNDVNGDGLSDLVCQFEDNEENWSPGDDIATLTGSLVSGVEFEGEDSICVVP